MIEKRVLTVALNGAGTGAQGASANANRVAQVLRTLGVAVTATGFMGGSGSDNPGEFLRAVGVQTAFHEMGTVISEAQADSLLAHFVSLLSQSDCVVLSGSLPPGLPADYYAELVSLCWRQTQVRTLVDTSGAALVGAVRAQPYLVKVNRAELAEWVGRPLLTEPHVLEAAQALSEAGPLLVTVSLGAQGLLMVTPDTAWRAVPPEVAVRHARGAGDALIAGLVAGLLREESPEEILRQAVACGTAFAVQGDCGEGYAQEIQRVAQLVRVDRISS